jgi:hypothetical protein
MLRIDDMLAVKGPVLLNEYDEFAKYFLSKVPAFNEPESKYPVRHKPYKPDARRDKRRKPSVKSPVDMDDLPLHYNESMPYIALRRGPASSRPPANYRRVWSGAFYEVWRRERTPRVLAHTPLGRTNLTPGGPVTGRDARAIARQARRAGGRIAFVSRRPMARYFATRVPRPPRWIGFGGFTEGLLTDGPAHLDAPVTIRRSGRYHVWMEGSFARAITLRVDGRSLGRTPFELNNPGAYVSFGTVELGRRKHGVEIIQGGGDLRPSNGGYRSSLRHIGPILFDPVENEPLRVRTIAAPDWRRLVGIRADWLEVVGPALPRP